MSERTTVSRASSVERTRSRTDARAAEPTVQSSAPAPVPSAAHAITDAPSAFLGPSDPLPFLAPAGGVRHEAGPSAAVPDAPSGDRLSRLLAPPGGAAGAGAHGDRRHHDHTGILADEAAAPDPGGEPLPPELQHSMGQAFGADLSRVRVFQGEQATAFGAAAYAHGDELHFAPGHYDPHSRTGQQLIGHELTHVMQQRASRVSAPQGKGDPVHVDPGLEAEADALGERAARGEPVTIAGGGWAMAGRAVQLKGYRGKVDKGKDNEQKMIACHDAKLVFEIAAKDARGGTLSKAISIGDIKKKLAQVVDPPPEFSLVGTIKETGEHTITVPVGKTKVVMNVSVRVEGASASSAKPRVEPNPYVRTTDEIPEPEPLVRQPAPLTAQFGTEFTFTNDLMFQQAKAASSAGSQRRQVAENTKKQKAWKEAVVGRKPPDLAYIEDSFDQGKCPTIKFTYTDGWWYRCSLDVACIETQTYKMSLADAKRRGWLDRLERDIFCIARELGLQTHVTTGGGHYHLDLESTFGGDSTLFRNFLVDFANNPLALEALENDPTNAPVIGQLQDHVRESFHKLIKEFDMMKLDRHPTGNDAIVELADKLQYGVYKHAFSHLPRHEQYDEPWKYQAVNVTRVADRELKLPDKTVEIRALRAQRSVNEFVLVARLLQSRIAMLKQLGEHRIDYKIKATRPQEHSDPSAVIAAFRTYVEQAGLAFADYEALVHANMAERHKGWIAPEKATSSSHGKGESKGEDAKGESLSSPAQQTSADLNMLAFDRADAHENTENSEVGLCDRRYPLSLKQIEELKSRKLRLTGTRPDGDCIYNGVSQSAGLGKDAGELREQVAKWCEQHRETLLETQFVKFDPSQRGAEFERTVATIRKQSERTFLGDHGDLALISLCALIGRGVTVLQPDGAVANLAGGGNPILLVFVQGALSHYYGTTPVS